ncbi:helix-turn-helix transcriptional regulator [Schleiferilactobacillus harbinensis]|uniref:helix-turn-helix transcriptional regulator n=1 Tax=Schleiferilactobacillus harbinensis TaxID=304207 RepID=UPI00345E1023
MKYKRLSADPSVFGITRGLHRRVTGLRREEVAERAHVSTDWYARIEQGRLGANPSPEVLAALCRVLQLSPAETRYVFNLVGQRPLERPVSGVSAALRDLMLAQLPRPAYLMDRQLTIVAWNPAFAAVYGDLTGQSALRRNVVWRIFRDPFLQTAVDDWREVAHLQTARFRQIYSSDADSAFLYRVFTTIKNNPVFQEAWDRLAVAEPDEMRFLLTFSENSDLYLVETTLQTPTGEYYLAVQNAGDTPTLMTLTQLGENI